MLSEKRSLKSLLFDQIFIVIACIFLLAPLGHPRFFWSHDEAQLLWRVTEFHQNVTSGAPLGRWFPDFARGFGLPFLEFFPVVFLFITEIFKLIGFGTILSIKTAIVLITLIGSTAAYLLGREYWGRTGGIIAGLLFTFAPYRIFDLFVRGDVNEYTAMALLPLNLWFLYRCAQQKPTMGIHLPLTLTSAAVFAAHYPSAVIHLPVYCVWIFALAVKSEKKVSVFRFCGVSLVAGLLLSAPWWSNAFANRHLVQMEGMTKGFANYHDQFIHPVQWFSFYWNYGASVKGTGDTVSFQIGNIALIFAVLGLSALLMSRRNQSEHRPPFWPLVLLFGTALFLTIELSEPIWELIPVLPLLQFPYRLLQVPALILALWGGSLGPVLVKRFPAHEQVVVPVLGAFILLFSLNMCRVGAYLELEESDLEPKTVARVAHTHCTGEFIPREVGKRFPPQNKAMPIKIVKIPDDGFSRKQMEEKVQMWLERAPHVTYWEGNIIRLDHTEVVPGEIALLSGIAQYKIVHRKPISITMSVNAQTNTCLRWGQFYFKGWVGKLNQHQLHLFPDPDTGLIAFNVPKGVHTLTIEYRNLLLGRYLEFMALICLGFILITKTLMLFRNHHVKD
jgi:6-pyruvoyl-tetrahydropterin synthase related domain